MTVQPAHWSGARGQSVRLPLYLRGTVDTHVSGQGASLLVRRREHADIRHPIHRLSRIIANRKVEFAASAIQLCLAHQIPLVLLASDGTPMGYIQPASLAPSTLDGLLCEMMEHPNRAALFQNWKRAQRMGLIREWVDHRKNAGESVDDWEYQQKIREYLQDNGSPPLATWPIFEGPIAAHVSQRIQQAGLGPYYWGNGGAVLDLRQEIIEHLKLALALEVGSLGATLHGHSEAILRLLHSFGPRLTEHIDRYLGKLHRSLRERFETWR